MPSKVYFIRTKDGEPDESLAEKALALYEKAGFGAQIVKGMLVGIKQHFGEKGGTGWLRPPIAKRFVERVLKSGAKPFLTDTTTLYKGHRGTAVDYLNLCAAHGFTHEKVGCPVIIADGLVGASQVFVKIDGKHYPRVPIAADAYHANAFIVLTHVTGHMAGGMGASIKNVGMGLSSRAGKLSQHHGDIPLVDPKKCTACGRCAELCPASAITVGECAVISRDKCIGCGECLAVCPFGAVGFRWDETSERLSEKMVEHALAVKLTHEGRLCHFNFMVHVTQQCDCFGLKQDAACPDVGIVASDDMVAADQAAADLLNAGRKTELFKELQPETRWAASLNTARKSAWAAGSTK